jgi:hypothetical protein
MSTATSVPTAPGAAPAEHCALCAGTGWADPWELGDGAPELVACDRCLGVGLESCVDCEGEGVVAVPRPCPCPEPSAA